MGFPEDFYRYMHNFTLCGIKGGRERESFLNIWMVTVDDRVFARSWNKSARSWFTAFIQSGEGQIKYGDQVIDVKGKKLEDAPELNELINAAYLHKYNQEGNVIYAQGISQPEYADYTMEFFYHPGHRNQ
jgi:hypothetical protein